MNAAPPTPELATAHALREAIVAHAARWENTPYHHQADVMGQGVDCAMLLVRVYAAAGLIPPELDPRPYPVDWHLHRSEEKYLGWLEQYATALPAGQCLAGDVVAYHFGRTYSHAGICVAPGYLLHAWRPARRVIISRLTDADLTERRQGVPRAAQVWRLNQLLGQQQEA